MGADCLQPRVLTHHLNRDGTEQLDFITTTVKKAAAYLQLYSTICEKPEFTEKGKKDKKDKVPTASKILCRAVSFLSLTQPYTKKTI